MPVPIVAYVASPLHVLSALAAIKTFHPKAPVRVTLVVNYPTADSTLLEQLHGIAKVMTDGMPLVDSCIAISNEMLSPLAGRSDVESAANEFRALVGFKDISEIYYFHDVMGVFFAMMAQSYPNARRICFGDGMGITYEREFNLSKFGIKVPKSIATVDPRPDKRTIWKRVLSTLTPPKRKLSRQLSNLSAFPFGMPSTLPHSAALILPIDESGDFLSHISWRVVRKPLALELLNELTSRCIDFRRHVDELLEGRDDSRKFLLLTECNSECQRISFERDVALYCEIIERYCPPGSVIYLKPHPAEHQPRTEAIRTRLGGKFELIPFGEQFKRYPIEFSARMVRECTPICMTYPTLSLKYLYGVDVIQPLSHSLIREWYPQDYWEYFDHAYLTLENPIRRLPKWNGQGLLWSGRWKAG